jgi:hypothetical protein
MDIDFSNIQEHVIPMDDFALKWRFTESEYNILPDEDLNQLKPLDSDASKFLNDFIKKSKLHWDVPFTKGFFKVVNSIYNGDRQDVIKWLTETGIQSDNRVFLSYGERWAIIVPWKLLVKYFDDFQYADDLTVFDEQLNWALLFFHEGEIYFGTNEA